METRKRKIDGVQVEEMRLDRAELVALGEGYILKTATGRHYRIEDVHEAWSRYGREPLGFKTCTLRPVWPDGDDAWYGGSSCQYGSRPPAVDVPRNGYPERVWWLRGVDQDALKAEMAAEKERNEKAKTQEQQQIRERISRERSACAAAREMLAALGVTPSAESYPGETSFQCYGAGWSLYYSAPNEYKVRTTDPALAEKIAALLAAHTAESAAA